MLETIITEVLQKKDKLFVTFKDLGSIYINWNHVFPSKILSKNGAINLEKKLQNSPVYNQIRFRRLESPFNIVQVKAPISLKKELPEEFIKGHYKEQMWNYFAFPGCTASIEDYLHAILNKRKQFETEINEINEEIINSFPQNKKPYHSTIFNKLNEIYFENKKEEIVTNSYTKKLNTNILKKREQIQNTYSELEKIAHSLNIEINYNKKIKSIDLVLSSTNGINVHGPLTHEKVLKQKWLFLDIEIPHFDREKPEISWVGLSYYQNGQLKKEIHTLSKTPTIEINKYQIQTHNSELDLVQAVKKSIIKENPYYISAYNAKFDLLKLKEIDFKIGERETNPIKEVSTAFFERIGIRGREVIDLLRWAQTCFDYLPNQKLETVAKEILGPDKFSKSISYEEMAKLEDLARFKNGISDLIRNNAVKKIASYLANDVDIMTDLFKSDQFQNFLEDMCLLSNSFRIPLNRLIYSSKSIQSAQDRSYFHETGIYYNEIYRKNKNNQNKRQKLKNGFKKRLQETFDVKNNIGLLENIHQCYLPYGFFLKNIISRKLPQSNSLFSIVSNDNNRRFNLSRFANNLAEIILIDYEDYKHKERFQSEEEIKRAKWRIKGKHNTTLEEIEKNMCRMKQIIENWIIDNNLKIIYQEGPYLYLQGGNKETYHRNNRSPLIEVNSLERILLTQKKIYFKKNGIIKNQKISNHPNYFHNIFEMETYGTFLENLLQGNIQHALEQLYFDCDSLLSKKVDPEKLIWKNKSANFNFAFSEGNRINFSPEYEGEIKSDVRGNYVESKGNKIYHMNLGQMNLDWKKYGSRNEEKVKEFLFPLVGKEYLKFTRLIEEVGFLKKKDFEKLTKKILIELK